MSRSSFHKAFGLVIASDLSITNLAEIGEQPVDVEIALVADDHDFADPRLRNRFANWRAGPDCFLLGVEDVAEFFVRDGHRIEIKPAADVTEEMLSAFLMGSAFATLLQQRRMLTLHASAVHGRNGAILFVGRSGIGKSTTMAAMKNRGFAMVTDDVAAIEFGPDGIPTIRTSFSGARLTARSLASLGESTSDYPKLNAEIEKYAFPAETVDAPAIEIERIVVLDINERPAIEVSVASRVEAFELLSFFTFRKRFYDGMELEDFHFGAVSKLVAKVPVLRALRPEHPFMLDELIEAVLGNLEAPLTTQAVVDGP